MNLSATHCYWLPRTEIDGLSPSDPNIHGAFRVSFTLEEEAEVEFRILGADWYRVWLDEDFLTEGPARFHPKHPEVEVLRRHLPAGRHLIAIQGHAQNVATQLFRGDEIATHVSCAILVNGKEITADWKCRQLTEWGRHIARRSGLQGWVEHYDQRLRIGNWRATSFDDSEWHSPAAVEPFWTSIQPLNLAELQQTRVTPIPMASGYLTGSFEYFFQDVSIGFFARKIDAVSSDATGRWWRFDLGRVRLGRLRMRLRSLSGAKVEVGIAEVLLHGRVLPWIYLSNSPSVWVDQYILDGSEEWIEAFVPRGGRFVEIHVQGEPTTLDLLEIEFIDRGYFSSSPASFQCGDALLEKIWHAGVETLRACSEDAVVDTPVRERGQWTGDTLSVGLELVTTLYDDSRLILRALRQIAQCAREDGLIPSLTPGANIVYFLSYACVWQEAAWNYYLRTGYTKHLHEIADAGRANLSFFESKIGPDGFNPGKELTFIDWGYIRALNEIDLATQLFLRRALRSSVEWFRFIGLDADADRWRAFLNKLDGFLIKQIDGAPFEELGYHIVALALGEGLIASEKEKDAVEYLKDHIMSCFPNDPNGPRLESLLVNHKRIMTPYFSHFVLPLLIERGEMDFVLERIRACWGWSLGEGRTTLTEVFDEHWTHSHHWSACPTWILSQYGLGLRRAFHRGEGHYDFMLTDIRLPKAQGTLPDGIRIDWTRDGDNIRWNVYTEKTITLHDASHRISNTPQRIENHATFTFAAKTP